MRSIAATILSALLLVAAVPFAAQASTTSLPSACNPQSSDYNREYIGYIKIEDRSGPNEYICIRGDWKDRPGGIYDLDDGHGVVNDGNWKDFDDIKNDADFLYVHLWPGDEPKTKYADCGVGFSVYDGWNQTLDEWPAKLYIWVRASFTAHQGEGMHMYQEADENVSSKIKVKCWSYA